MATILVADDDHLLRAIIRECLERAGHTVLEAGDGIAALDIALDERPDCLLLDVMMPLARGLEVVRQVRLQEDWYPAIVMISARTRFADRMNALDAGANAYVEKPFEPDALLTVIDDGMHDAGPGGIVDRVSAALAELSEPLADPGIDAEPQHEVTEPVDDHDPAQRYLRERIEITLGRRPSESEDRAKGFFRDNLDVALGRGHPVDGIAMPATPAARATESLFGQAIRGTLAHAPEAPRLSSVVDASLQSLWEDALETVAGGAIEREIPAIHRPRIPRPVAVLFDRAADDVLDAHRALASPDTVVDAYWGDVLTATLTGKEPAGGPGPTRDPQAVERASRDALRLALAGRDGAAELNARWHRVIAELHRRDEESTHPVVLDSLEAVWIGAGARTLREPLEVGP